MRENAVFCHEKFKELLIPGTIAMTMEFIMLLTDTLIASHLVGEEALSGLNLVMPLVSLSIFFCGLISMGPAHCFSREMGKLNHVEANKYFGMSLFYCLVLGIFMSVISYFGAEIYLDFFSPSPLIREQALAYYTYLPHLLLVYPLYMVLSAFVMEDGDGAAVNASCVAQFFGNILLSVYLCLKIGVAGISLGSVVGSVSAIIILSTHFLRKRSALKINFNASWQHFKNSLPLSIIDSVLLLCWAVSSLAFNKFVIGYAGDKYLPVLAVVFSVIEMTLVFDGIGGAFTPALSVYYGEKNTSSIKILMKYTVKTAIYEGLLAILLLFLTADYIPLLIGLNDGELISLSARAVRIVAPSMLFVSLIFVWTSYYLLVNKIGIALILVLLEELFFQVGFSLAAGHFFGLDGLWAGIGLAPPAAYLVVWLYYKFVREEEFTGFNLPWQLNGIENTNKAFNWIVTEENTKKFCTFLTEFLAANDCNEREKETAKIVTEKAVEQILDYNPKKPVLSEWTVFVSKEEISLVIRDTGVLSDITKRCTSLLTNGVKMRYLITMGNNRTIFVFLR